MADVASARAPKKPGPELPASWRARFLEAYRTRGGLWRAAEAAGVHPETVRRHRADDPVFDQQVLEAREYYADTVEEDMMALGERSDNPVPHIVRLKALRPHQYIEKHAVMTVNVTTQLDGPDAAELLRAMLGAMSPAAHALIADGPPTPALEPHPPSTGDGA